MKIIAWLKRLFTIRKPNPMEKKSFAECVEDLINEKINDFRQEANRTYRTSHLDSKLIAEEASRLAEMRIRDEFDNYREELRKMVKNNKAKTNKVIKELEEYHAKLNDDFWKNIDKYVKGRIETSIEVKARFIYERVDECFAKLETIPTVEQLLDKKEEIEAILKSAKHSVSVADTTIKSLNEQEKRRHDALEYMAKRISEFSGELKQIRDNM